MAVVHTQSWQETYRGLVDDQILDSPRATPRRERMWTEVITESANGTTTAAVAEADGSIVGIALSGAPRDEDAVWPVELYVLYLLAEHHGSGAGRVLLDAVIGDQPAALWGRRPESPGSGVLPQSRVRTRRCHQGRRHR